MAKNKRCPLQQECGRKCEYAFNELECDYYANNGIGDNTIPDQEERRKETERKRDEQLYADTLDELETDEGGIVWIDINRLHPHPDNPRKDLGDLTELSDSIKAKGVLQNLTVVKDGDGFKVIIGHRRTEAARRAGLTKLPCIITEMTPAEQVQTMLLENMQRSDLTVYEQAQGFQMMLDFGDSIDDLSQKTGFSKTTIRKRLKMAELDGKIFEDVSSRQFTFEDIDKLEKIENLTTRNLVLATLGTKNFENEYKKALEAQEAAKKKAAWQELFDKYNLVNIDYNDRWSKKYLNLGYEEGQPNEGKIIEMTEKYNPVYYAWGYNGTLYFNADKVYTDEENEEIQEQERRRAAEAEKRKALSELTKRAYHLRFDFIKEYPLRDAKRNIEKITEWMSIKEIVAMSARDMFSGYYNSQNTSKAFGELFGVKGGDEFDKVLEIVQNHPEKALLWIVYSQWCDSEESSCYDYNCKFKENPKLNNLYKGLESIGYEISDEETAMLDGTHKLFHDEAEESNATDTNVGDKMTEEELYAEVIEDEAPSSDEEAEGDTDKEIISALRAMYGDNDDE